MQQLEHRQQHQRRVGIYPHRRTAPKAPTPRRPSEPIRCGNRAESANSAISAITAKPQRPPIEAASSPLCTPVEHREAVIHSVAGLDQARAAREYPKAWREQELASCRVDVVCRARVRRDRPQGERDCRNDHERTEQEPNDLSMYAEKTVR